ncbi:hypothetical protein QOT17_009303 [Balamuthia mandrillaris]
MSAGRLREHWRKASLVKDSLVDTFTRHKTFFTVSGTVLSCLAAWFSYAARVRHQAVLERHLHELNEKLKKNNIQEPLPPKLPPSKLYQMGSTLVWTGVTFGFGYFLGRIHSSGVGARTMALWSRLKSKTTPHDKHALPSSSSSSFTTSASLRPAPPSSAPRPVTTPSTSTSHTTPSTPSSSPSATAQPPAIK